MRFVLFAGSRIAKPSVLVGLVALVGGLVLTLLDDPVGILPLGLGLMWVGAMLQSRRRRTPIGWRKR
ncbi:hypothetical protein BRC81_09170 [Halobacteriales archaeon QS_1_68_20]|nr:MAG: hypothetical protein BRC81_09170 [Halobacteriales archaeon QS_1_68_20]